MHSSSKSDLSCAWHPPTRDASPETTSVYVTRCSAAVLTIERRHVRITVTDRGGKRRQGGELVIRQHHGIRRGVLLDAFDPLRARDGCDIVALGQQPGEGHLSGRR